MSNHAPEEYKVDRSRFPAGPWDAEPDKLVWTTEAGLPGMIVRNGLGALCGYAAVPPSHPWHGRGYSDGEWPDTLGHQIDVHGGLTYADACAGHVCHVPAPGEPDNVWWFGFDCAHAGDLVPGLLTAGNAGWRTAYEVYRDVAFVRAEVEQLALQLARAFPL
jgi:hypothetical protein